MGAIVILKFFYNLNETVTLTSRTWAFRDARIMIKVTFATLLRAVAPSFKDGLECHFKC